MLSSKELFIAIVTEICKTVSIITKNEPKNLAVKTSKGQKKKKEWEDLVHRNYKKKNIYIYIYI